MELRIAAGITLSVLGACTSGEDLDNKSRSDFENLTRPPPGLIHRGPERAPALGPEERNQMERDLGRSMNNMLAE